MRDGPLEIAFIAQDFPPNVGGTHVYNVEFAQRLHARGHVVKLLTWETQTPGVDEADASLPFPVERLRFERRHRGIEPRGVPEILGRWRADVALVSGGSGAVSKIVRAAVDYLPVTVAVHDLRDKGSSRGRLGRWRVRRRYGFDRAARITANSEHTRDRLIRLGVSAEKVAIVHPGVDTARYAPDPAAGEGVRRELGLGGRPVLLTVARLAPNKGHGRVLELLPRLREKLPDLVYVVVGGGGLRDALERRAEELGVREMVRFAGSVPDVRPYYNACDVFVMASTPTAGGAKAGEGFGMAYVEAGACGKPVIASTSGGGAEIVVDGETGLSVTATDDVGLERALSELLTRPDWAQSLGEKARQRVQRYDWSHGVDALEGVLREAATAQAG